MPLSVLTALGLLFFVSPIYKLRLGTKLAVIITSPSLVRQVLKDHDVIFANHDVPVAGLAATYGGFDIAWTPYGPEWWMLRKVCVLQMLSKTTLDSVHDLLRKQVRPTVGFFYGRVKSSVNVGEQMFLNTLNVVTNMLWGGTVREEAPGSGGVVKQMEGIVKRFDAIFGKVIDKRLRMEKEGDKAERTQRNELDVGRRGSSMVEV
ncbi:PREDICTED: premnaspirodiene oxygenase-like [Fragaria vesca subsp. vesca]|uniref:premnaspirodiene oxygenase-like n=1 Tax=Fragaria vesca subsp. vesca TaxID=101020 RepID=UPI0002C310DD|nr:PREDICTED: premnaspirodiene oxygenase-like [Fragaria vesca subsp. vesca]